jgi:lysophospholipid acyltransferase 1/2
VREERSHAIDAVTRYYFAFILAEAVNNAGGLGFNGLDKDGAPRWDLLTNIKPFQLETATSLKTIFDYWNMRKRLPIGRSNRGQRLHVFTVETALWLRRICYYRIKKSRTLCVFVLSAIWVRLCSDQDFTSCVCVCVCKS